MTIHIGENMTSPCRNTATEKLIADRIRDLSRRTQAEIASEAGFPSGAMPALLKNG